MASIKINKLKLFTFFILFCLYLAKIEEVPAPDYISCLKVGQQKVTQKCIRNLNVKQLVSESEYYTIFVCPLFIKIYQARPHLREQIHQKTQQLCSYAAELDIQNGYLLLGPYFIKGQYIKALFLQYQLFFKHPFQHQQKFKQALTRFQKYMIPTQLNEDSNQIDKFNQAIKLYYLNRIDKSLGLLNQIQSQIINSQGSISQLFYFIKLRIIQKNGQFTQALQYVNNVLQQKKDKIHWYFQHIKGNLLMHHLKFRQAIQVFQQAILGKQKLGQFFSFSYYNAGLCYQKLGQYQESIKYFRAIIEKGQSSESYNALGMSYYMMADLTKTDKETEIRNNKIIERARMYFQKAIKLKPNFISHYNLATLQYVQGKYSKCIVFLQSSLKLNSGKQNIGSKYMMYKALYKTNKQKAVNYLKQQLLIIPEVTYYELGMLYYELDQYQMARTYLQQAIQQKKGNLGQAYEWKGLAEFHLNKLQQAQASFKGALQNGNTKAQIWYNLGHLEELKQNYNKAQGLYKKAMEKSPKGPAKQRLQQLKKKSRKDNQQL